MTSVYFKSTWPSRSSIFGSIKLMRESPQESFRAAGLGDSASAVIQYTEDLGHRLFEIVVHHPMVELLCGVHLVLRIGHTQGERLVVLGLPAVKALAEDVA